MKLFIDSVDIKEIKAAIDLGICDGVTTNPSLVAKSGKDFKTLLNEIVNIVPGHVFASVISTDFQGMIKEAETLSKIGNNIVIQLPLTPDGLKACRVLGGRGIKTNVTLCFSVAQALIAAKAGATYISPFITACFPQCSQSSIDEINQTEEEGLTLIKEIKNLYLVHKYETKILAAGVDNEKQVTSCAVIGSDAITMSYKIFTQLYSHSLTEAGLKQFMGDWKDSDQSSIV
jgi:transaldolase